MKKLGCIFVLIIFEMLLTSCKNVNSDNNTLIESESGIYDTLTEEQKSYLREQRFLKELVNDMSYETLNWYLIGTGYELYNQTKGVEKNGISYIYEENVEPSEYGTYYHKLESCSQEKITLQEAVDIRKKENEMKIEDFLKYTFIKEYGEASEVTYMFPVSDYKDTYIRLVITENTDGNILMKCPVIVWFENTDDKGGKIKEFSLMYRYQLFETFANTEPKYSIDNKIISYIHNATVTDSSLVIEIWNGKNIDLEFKDSFSIYKIEGEKEEKVVSKIGTEMMVSKAGTFSIKAIDFSENNLTEGRYKLVFGESEDGVPFEEMTFVIEN